MRCSSQFGREARGDRSVAPDRRSKGSEIRKNKED